MKDCGKSWQRDSHSFNAMMTDEEIEDVEDLRALREARATNEGKPRISHAEMKRLLGTEKLIVTRRP